MAFKLQDFRSAVRDLARGHLYEVQIIFPTIIGSEDMVNLMVHSHGLPGRKVAPTTDTAFMGMMLKLANDIEYTNWTSKFRVDENYDLYKKIKAWHELVHGTETNIAAFPAQYKSLISIRTLDIAGNYMIQVDLNGCWPSDVQSIAFDTQNRNVTELSVTWAYDYNVFKVL